jgi:transcriptional repressor NrdR
LLRGLLVATTTRGVPVEQLEALIDDVAGELHNTFRYEVDSRTVGDMVLRRLRDLDKVAYVRFASVYKEFKDLDEFTSELKSLS